jgi:L-2,4-diaminobutyric acid acetyltransferase
MGSSSTKSATATVLCRSAQAADAPQVHSLVKECKPLDLNSTYAYLLLCSHFANTCVVAQREGRLVGFVSSYKKPAESAVLFVWQVAVSATARGEGLASQMLDELLQREDCRAVRWVETTIAPTNEASWALFESLAKRRGALCAQETLFQPEDFGTEGHEEERLLRIGPLRPTAED